MVGAFPYADEAALRAALQIFCASAAYAQLERRYDKYATYTGFLAEGDSGIKALWTAFNSTMPTVRPRHPRTLRAWLQTRRPGGGRSSLVLLLRQNIETSATAISKYYDPWRKAVSDTCNDVAPCMMADGAYYRYMGMTFTLVNTATLNIAIALVVSYFILLIFTGRSSSSTRWVSSSSSPHSSACSSPSRCACRSSWSSGPRVRRATS